MVPLSHNQKFNHHTMIIFGVRFFSFPLEECLWHSSSNDNVSFFEKILHSCYFLFFLIKNFSLVKKSVFVLRDQMVFKMIRFFCGSKQFCASRIWDVHQERCSIFLGSLVRVQDLLFFLSQTVLFGSAYYFLRNFFLFFL